MSCKNFAEWLAVVFRYYPIWEFARVDIYLLRNYIGVNPYRVCSRYLKEKGVEEVYVYGETPLTTVEIIAHECGINAADNFYELGAGRGRACFWLRFFVGCKVNGVEFVPLFVKIAQKTARTFHIDKCKFIFRDILDVDLSDATVIYFYGTSSDTRFILALIDKLKKVKPGTKVITVSYPLTHYQIEPVFELVKHFPVQFTWGQTDVYLHVRK